MTDQQKIIELLSDGEYHCPTKELYMKDDRARISGLRKKGFVFDSPRCELCPAGTHSSAVVMRKIIVWPDSRETPKDELEKAIEELSEAPPVLQAGNMPTGVPYRIKEIQTSLF